MFKKVRWTPPEEYISVGSEVETGNPMPMTAGMDNLMLVDPGLYDWCSPSIDEFFEEEDRNFL